MAIGARPDLPPGIQGQPAGGGLDQLSNAAGGFACFHRHRRFLSSLAATLLPYPLAPLNPQSARGRSLARSACEVAKTRVPQMRTDTPKGEMGFNGHNSAFPQS